MNLTIFQKMLTAPVIGMLLYGAYLTLSYGEHRQASTTIEEIRDGYLPVMELAGENILLFEGIVTQFKDAVLAGEKEWLAHTEENRVQIVENLSKMGNYGGVVSPSQLRQMQQDLSLYYGHAHTLSLTLLGEEVSVESRNTLIENVEHYHTTVTRGFTETRDQAQKQIHLAVESTNQRLSNLLIMGVIIGVFLIIIVIALTFVFSMATRKSLCELIDRMKALAQGKPDFSKRLVEHSRDELGTLTGWFNLLSDKLEKDYKKIELLSITDKLTQLYNRTKIDQLFADELKRAGRFSEGFSVILIDLDHFKSVNDDYGHQVGDTVLQELAQLLRESVRETDYVGRWGGEEFIVISPNADISRAMQLAEKLRVVIDQFRFTEVGHKTASFGVVTYRSGDDEDSMTQRVDELLYRAKEQGRNRVVGEGDLD